MTSEVLLNVYQAMVESAGCEVEDGLISQVLAGDSEPVMINGKRAALPTSQLMAQSDRSNLHIIHPLAEHLTRVNLTPDVEKLVGLMNTRLDFVFSDIAYQLLVIAASPTEQAKLNPVQNEFLSAVPNATEDTVKAFMKLLDYKPVDGVYKTMVSMFIKRNGTYKEKTYKRVAVVYFPLYEELKNGKKKIMNTQISEKDRLTILALLEYMIPGIADIEAYNYGSSSDVAPIMDAVVHGFAGLTGSVNQLVDTFKNILEDADKLRIRDDWMDKFDDLSWVAKEVRKIPRQGQATEPDVEGGITSGQPTPAVAQQTERKPLPWESAPTPQPQQGYGQPTQPQQQTNVVNSNGRLNFGALMRSRPDQYQQPSPYTPQAIVQPRQSTYYDRHNHRPNPVGIQTNYTGHGGNTRRFST